MIRLGALRMSLYWRLQIAGWSGLYLLIMAAAMPHFTQPGIFRFNNLACLILFFTSMALRPVCRRSIRAMPSLLPLAFTTFGTSAMAGATMSLVAELVTYGTRKFQWADWLVSAVQSTLILFLWCSLYFIIKQWQFAVKERERLLIMQAEMKEAKLSALRYQLGPHFLFNALNAVSTLYLEENGEAAADMLSRICDLLRTVLSADTAPAVTLRQEIDLVEKYLAIEKVRLGTRLNVTVDVAPEAADVLVPSMLLQPLVENAVKHGIASTAGPGFVLLKCCIDGDALHIVVRNSGSMRSCGDAQAPFSGIGLANTRERLRTAYEYGHGFSVHWPPEGGCEVSITVPDQRGGA